MSEPLLRIHTVRPGETLSRISSIYYHKGELWPRIAEYNHLVDGKHIIVGQKLKILSLDHIAKLAARRPKPAAAKQNHKSTDRAGHDLARELRYPPWSHAFPDLPVFRGAAPPYYVVAKMTSDITLKIRDKTLQGIEVSNEGLKIESEYNSRFSKLSGNFNFKRNNKGGIDVSNGFTSATKMNGKEFYSTEVKMIPPNTISYTISPKEIAGEAFGCEFSGKIGFCLELTSLKDNKFQPSPVEQPNWLPIILAVPVVRGIIGAAEVVGSMLEVGATALTGLFIISPVFLDPHSGPPES